MSWRSCSRFVCAQSGCSRSNHSGHVPVSRPPVWSSRRFRRGCWKLCMTAKIRTNLQQVRRTSGSVTACCVCAPVCVCSCRSVGRSCKLVVRVGVFVFCHMHAALSCAFASTLVVRCVSPRHRPVCVCARILSPSLDVGVYCVVIMCCVLRVCVLSFCRLTNV